jgi:hypothetical protein
MVLIVLDPEASLVSALEARGSWEAKIDASKEETELEPNRDT